MSAGPFPIGARRAKELARRRSDGACEARQGGGVKGVCRGGARDLRDLKPRDMIDIQSFTWVQGSDEYEE
jgi:hypothetical protein